MSQKPLGDNADKVRRLTVDFPDMKVAEIALALGLTTQRVYQLLDALRKRGQLPPDEEDR